MIEMNQNINQLISELFRGNFGTKKHCCKNNIKFTMAKLIAEELSMETNTKYQYKKNT